jgi:hypothetical protein
VTSPDQNTPIQFSRHSKALQQINRSSFAFLIISVLLGVLFFSFPEIDLWASGLFYNQKTGFFFRVCH